LVSLYFHIPYCRKKCPYCHFYVIKPTQVDRFREALKLEWQKRQPLIQDKKITSIYFGGGTPSLIDPRCIEEILQLTGQGEEITIEANPEDITPELMETYLKMGINRLSIGVQSLHDATLKTIGRAHSAQKAINAIHTAKTAGFNNITIDLMYDLPHQTPPSWEHTLKQLYDLPISHVSLYNLTFEEPSVFHRKQRALQPHLPSEDDSLKMLQSAIKTLEEIGLKRYEISAFGLPSVHNTGYWIGRPFLGFGPSAFSYWDGRRFRNAANLVKYAEALESDKPWVDFTEKLSPEAHQREMLAIGLRLTEGVNPQTFQQRYGSFSSELKLQLAQLQKNTYLTVSELLKLTSKGQLFYDTVASEIISIDN